MNKDCECVLGFANQILHYIEMLNNIDTKVDYPDEYANGYNDACVAIKNTVNTLLGKEIAKE